MKKYRTLLLTLVAITSLILFLVYRHEYNRLHYVLEVFNFFGQPCNLTDLVESKNIVNHFDWGPHPLWQQHEDNTHFYSGFWKGNTATVIVTREENVYTHSCYLWYEDKNVPIPGKFEAKKFGYEVKTQTTGYTYHCKPLKTDKNAPYAVSFYKKSYRKILLNHVDQNSVHYNITLCVASSKQMNKRAFIEFLSYHKVVGVDSYIFYTNDISHKLSKFITNFSNRLAIEFTIYSWNYPKEDDSLTRSIVEQDCNFRTTPYSNYVVTLDINEYIVPSTYASLQSVFGEYGEHSKRLSLAVQEICVKNVVSNKPIALQNDLIFYSDQNNVRIVYRGGGVAPVQNTESLDKQFLSIYQYKNCTPPDRKHKDTSMNKFSTDFMRSTLYQLWSQGQI